MIVMKNLNKCLFWVLICFLVTGCAHKEVSAPVSPASSASVPTSPAVNAINYDLTGMGSDMVYATVFQLMQNPQKYIGKTFKIKGIYYPSYCEATGQYYHYCIIEDATACCAQGLEFIWEDGSHSFPDDYPPKGAEIIVTGIYETYQEDTDPTLYCRLNQAKLEMKTISVQNQSSP